MARSFEFDENFGSQIDGFVPPECPHCGNTIQLGDTVHWFDSTLWHTKPCP